MSLSGLGPDRITPSENYTTVKADGTVKLRLGDSDPDNREPISVPSLLKSVAAKAGDHLALTVKREGQWVKWTYQDYLADVENAAKGFIKLGLESRSGVGIIGFNSPEWFISDLAAVFAGGMAAGIYPTNNPEACKYIMKNCRANILVAEDEKQVDKFLPYLSEMPDLKAIIQYTGTPKGKDVIGWADLIELGKKTSDDLLRDRLEQIAINQCCHLVYTSGTTGSPKGVMLSHDNLTFTAKMLCDIFEMKDKIERLVSYLPLSHVAANICDLFVMLTCSSTVYFADKNALKGTLKKTLQEALPTLFFGVPRVWEKFHEKMLEVGRQNKGWKQDVGTWAKKTGLEHNRNLLNGAGQGAFSIKYKIANAVVFSKVKAQLGLNKCQRFYAAAAPMSKENLEYFLSLDFRILEIYGMSECSGPQLSNTHENQRIGTIGKELPGFHNKISKSGEILALGRHVMMGYLENEEKTREAFDEDGWLKSGDVGKIDSDGFVSITGRFKELIITAGGENIPPVLLEDNIKAALPCLSNAMVIGDRRKFLSCLLTLKVEVDPDTLEPTDVLSPCTLDWLQSIESPAKTIQDCLIDKRVKDAIQEGINEANKKAASNAQKIQKWSFLLKDFSVPGAELGPTLKVKRHVVQQKYQHEIEAFYA